MDKTLREQARALLAAALSSGDVRVAELLKICQLADKAEDRPLPDGWRIEEDAAFRRCKKKDDGLGIRT